MERQKQWGTDEQIPRGVPSPTCCPRSPKGSSVGTPSAVTELFCCTTAEIMEFGSLFENLVVCYYTCHLRFKRHRLFKDYKPSKQINTV